MFYVLDDNKNLVPAFDQEGFLAILRQAIEDQSLENIDPTSAIASKLRSIINDKTWTIEFITRSQYNELKQAGELDPDTYYVITDENIFERVDDLERSLPTDLDGSLDGFTQATSISAGFYIVVLKDTVYDAQFTGTVYFDGVTETVNAIGYRSGGSYNDYPVYVRVQSNGSISAVYRLSGFTTWNVAPMVTTYVKKMFAPTN